MKKNLIKSRILCTLFGGTLALSVHSQEWKLVWSDEFDVDGKPNEKVWSYEHGFTRNNEAQWYQTDNAICQDGLLIIEGKKESVKNPNFTPDSYDW
ncbi:MAG: beta-glucanase, partial [Bacteroidaceae bacterium]|nr:beta-glucanase [Bacteroidaceae bacterium]